MTTKTAASIKPHPDFRMAHPGELLAEDIATSRQNKTALAQRLGITRKMLYDILDGTSAVTANMALKLEAGVGSSAEFWLGLQMQHDLWKARKAAAAVAPVKPARAKKRAA